MSVEAGSKEAAIKMMKKMMNKAAIVKHFAEKHPGQAVLAVAQVKAMIEQNLQLA